MTTRVGVVADTHCPEFLDRLPERLFEVLKGVDLILHAGDINSEDTLAALRRLAPVEAVRGDHDRAYADLPLSRALTVEGRRIVIVHGNRSRWIEEPQTLVWTLSLGAYHPHAGLPHRVHRRLPVRLDGGAQCAHGERDHQHAARVESARQAAGGEVDHQPGDTECCNDPAELDVAQVEIGPH